jgi:hypothetical protein
MRQICVSYVCTKAGGSLGVFHMNSGYGRRVLSAFVDN